MAISRVMRVLRKLQLYRPFKRGERKNGDTDVLSIHSSILFAYFKTGIIVNIAEG